MTKGVVYVVVGNKHTDLFESSLWTLLKHWDGGIAVLTDNVAPLSRFSSVVALIQVPLPALKNPAFTIKSWVPRLSPFDQTIFLDADTLVDGDLTPLLPLEDELVLTCHPKSTQDSDRLKLLVTGGYAHPDVISRLIVTKRPSVNTGVFAVPKTSKVGPEWERVSPLLDTQYSKDETALQLLLGKYPHRWAGTEFNRMPWEEPHTPSAIVWHTILRYYGMGRAAELWANTQVEIARANWCGCTRDTLLWDKETDLCR